MDLYEKFPLCLYCKLELTPTRVVFDHKQPLSRKGEHSIGNLSVTCIDCNQLKQARTDKEFRKFNSENFYLTTWQDSRQYRGNQKS